MSVLVVGTALVGVGYGLAGLTGSLYGVIVGLLLAGLGGSALLWGRTRRSRRPAGDG